MHTRSWQETYRGILPEAYLDAMEWEERAAFWRERLTLEPAANEATLVAVREEAIVGFASIGPARDEDLDTETTWELYAIYVLQKAQGTSTGSGLLESALGCVPEQVRQLTLWVVSQNARARAFYERKGFSVDVDAPEQVAERGGTELVQVRYVATL